MNRASDQPAARDRAVVLGGSIAGTLAARVLSEVYGEVVVIDRDEVLGVGVPRRGAPHAVHAHGLHARGVQILGELFPGLVDEARALHLVVGDFGEMRWFFNARRVRPARTGLVSITGSRSVLENHLRSRVAALPNVVYRQRTELLGLVAAPDNSRVTGVRLRDAEAAANGEGSGDGSGKGAGEGAGKGAGEYRLDADLVVDATGRGSRTPVWLAEMGYERPPEERMRIGLAYTTRFYRERPEMFDGDQAINPVASPVHRRGAFFGHAGPGECRVTLTGVLGDHPPTDPEGFVEFARSLPVPDVYEAVKDAEATSDPVSFGFPASIRRHYERLARFPGGLLLLGDAVCSFNPVYGQGMTVASMQAMALRDHLRRHRSPEPLVYLAELARVVDFPWQTSTSGDLGFPEVEGERPWKLRMRNAYMARVQYAASKDRGHPGVLPGGGADRPAELAAAARPGGEGAVAGQGPSVQEAAARGAVRAGRRAAAGPGGRVLRRTPSGAGAGGERRRDAGPASLLLRALRAVSRRRRRPPPDRSARR